MIPRTIRSGLARLRRRERFIRFVWGAGRWLALVIAFLCVCALTDYLIDRDRDTPWSIRYALFVAQVVVAAVAAIGFVLWPQLRRLRNSELALWVEASAARLGHRLITAVELNQPGAQTAGMSDELIVVVTQEAERLSGTLSFPRVADHRRLGWSLLVLVPVVLIALAPLALWPELTLTLLQRQALLDVEVPRLVRLESITPPVLPVGERFAILYRVTGPVTEDTTGDVIVSSDVYKLTFKERLTDGAALFEIAMPPATTDLTYSARLGDGRTRYPDHIHFVARPIVTKQDAWVVLPEFCSPGRPRFEQAQQGHGDVVGIDGSDVRVEIATSKLIRSATLEILGPEKFDPSRTDEEPGPEIVKDTVLMTIGASGQDAAATFALKPTQSAYRIVVADEHGFVNVPPPRRSLRLVPEEPPQVILLKDYFGPDVDSDVEGIPVPIGKAIRIPYVAHGPYGLGTARILYRVLPKADSGENAVEPGEWTRLPLAEVTSRPELGEFDPKRGVFKHSGDFDPVPFYAMPSPDPQVLGRQIGGGRYFLQTKNPEDNLPALVDAKGKPITLHKGDQVEYCVEVFADRDINRGRPSARSETRVTTVVDAADWRNWLKAVLREEEALRKLDAEQRGLFGK